LIRYSSAERLAAIREMLAKVDAPPEPEPRPVLRTYSPRRRRAVDLVEDFNRRWREETEEDEDMPAAVNVIAATTSNRVLVRAPEDSWARILELLRELDTPGR
jgi:type II secretory pathway component GspD/PulD (secretin)